MALYLISYDIAEKDAFEYQPLWDKLRQLKAERILYSEWIANGSSSADLYNALAVLIQKKDRLLVVEIGGSANWDKLMISDDDFRAWFRSTRF